MISRGGCRTAVTYKVELFVMIVNGFQPLSTITKSSTLDVAAVLDLSLISIVLYDIFLKKYANNVATYYLFCSYMLGPVFPGFTKFNYCFVLVADFSSRL